MNSESAVKRRVKQILANSGAYAFMPVQTGYGNKTLDLLCCYKGYFIAIECKYGKNKPTPYQMRTIQEIIGSQGVVLVINEHNIDDLVDLLKRLNNHVKDTSEGQ